MRRRGLLSGDNKGMIKAMMAGFAPEGFVVVLDPEGQPSFARTQNVQTLLNNGYSVVNGPQ